MPHVVAFRGRSVALAAGSSGAAMLLVGLGLLWIDGGSAGSVWRLSLAVWCSITLASGLAMLGAWCVGGRARPARFGAALVTAASLVSLVPVALPSTAAPSQDLAARSLALVAILSVAGVQVVRSIIAPDVEAGLRPLRSVPGLIAIAAGVSALAVVLAPVRFLAHGAVNLLPVAVCSAAAVGVLVLGAGRPPAAVRAVAASMVLLAGGLYARVDPHSTPVVLVASVSLAVSAGLLGTLGAESVRQALRGHRLRSLRTVSALADYRTAASRERERRHDALSALAAIRSASEVLTSNSSDLGADRREDLSMAVRAELSRVERMLAPEDACAQGDVDLGRVLDPVVLAWRHKGMQIHAPSRGHVVHAMPDVVARIVNNLLHNAHCHAPGSQVHLVVDETEDAVHLSIVDSGPGVPRQRRPAVFAAGASWSESGVGQGLGLASARRLADEQGGELRLLDVDGGCWFVLSLPRTRSAMSARRQGPAA